jgi:hypothetical protein
MTRTLVALALLIAVAVALAAVAGGDFGTSATPLIVKVIDKSSPILAALRPPVA